MLMDPPYTQATFLGREADHFPFDLVPFQLSGACRLEKAAHKAFHERGNILREGKDQGNVSGQAAQDVPDQNSAPCRGEES